MKCTETQGKWCKNKHGALKIIDTFETYQVSIGEGAASEVDQVALTLGWCGQALGRAPWW
jgi:hypothetical protein